MRPWCIGGLLAAAISTPACGPGPLDQTSFPERRPLGERLAINTTHGPIAGGTDAGRAQPLADPAGVLTLRQAMALAVSRSPALSAYALDVRVAEARALQAGRWPNPELEGELEDFAGSGPFAGTDAIKTTLSIAQAFPLGGDIDRRRRLSQHETQLAGWDYEAARLEVLTRTARRYIGVLSAQRRVAITREALGLSERVRQMIRRRVDAGDASPLEVVRASVPVVQAQVAARQAERELAAARQRLALMWGSGEPGFESLAGALDDIEAPPPPDRLVDLLNENPSVARWATRISARRAEAELAKAEATPDLTGRLGYKHDNADDAGALVVGVSLPLPVFDRRRGDVLAARLGVKAARQRHREAELRLEAMLSSAYTQLANAYDRASAIRDVVLPPAIEAFDVTQRAFESGDLSLLDVLDAERTLVDLKEQHLEALASYHASVAEIEGLVGRPITQLATDTTKTPTDLE